MICPSLFDVPMQAMQPSVMPDGAGGQTVQFDVWFNVWAAVKLGARSERFREMKIAGCKFYTLTMHYDARITDKTAMLIDGQLWNVRSADGIDGKKEFMEVVVQIGDGV